MKPLLFNAVIALSLTLLAGCAAVPERATQESSPGDAGEVPDAGDLPYTKSSEPVGELSSDIVFNALAGEVAAQRGELELAYRHLMRVATLSGDAKAAERATRLAIFLKNDELAMEAIARWVELAPNDMSARQLGAALALRNGQNELAYTHLKAIVAISVPGKQDGFLYAMAAVSREKDNQGSVGLLERLAADYPDDPRGLYVVALTALMGKSYDLAETRSRQLIEQHPDWPKGYLLLSRIHVARDNKPAARELLSSAVNRYPQEQILRTSYARILLDFDEKELAFEQFRQIEKLSPDNVDALFALGVLALDMERLPEARKHFLRLRQLEKRLDESAYYLGRIEESDGQPDKAQEWYQKVRKGELSYEAQIRSAKLKAAQGKLTEARDWLKSMRIHMPEKSVQLYLVEVEVLRDHGTPEGVMALYGEGLKAHPGDENLLYSRALYAVTLDRLDILERDLNKVIAVNPKNADALNALGYTLADQTERFDEALDLITRALKLKPEAPAILDSMGWVHFRLGNLDQAVDYLRKAMNLLPDSEIASHLGEVLWVMGKQEQARKVWQDALKDDPESKFILETMQRLDP